MSYYEPEHTWWGKGGYRDPNFGTTKHVKCKLCHVEYDIINAPGPERCGSCGSSGVLVTTEPDTDTLKRMAVDKPNQAPGMGRIVRYVPPENYDVAENHNEYAALITHVHDGGPVVDLQVFRRTNIRDAQGVEYDEGQIEQSQTAAPTRTYKPGTWHWPPR